MITESQALGSGDTLFGDTFFGDTLFGDTLFGDTLFGGAFFGEPARDESSCDESSCDKSSGDESDRGESSGGEEPGWDPCAGSLDAPACPSLGCWRAMLLESLASVDAKMDIWRPCLVARLDIGGNLMAHGRQAAQKSSDG